MDNWKFTTIIAEFEHENVTRVCMMFEPLGHAPLLWSLLEMNTSKSIYKDVEIIFNCNDTFRLFGYLFFWFFLYFLYISHFYIYDFLSNLSIFYRCKTILKVEVVIILNTINYSLILGNSYREIREKFINVRNKKKIYLNYKYNIISIWTNYTTILFYK